jgi:hypothetical protein
MNSSRVSDLQLGETVTIQIIALTNHPVGKYSPIQQHPNYTMDYPQREELLNELNTLPPASFDSNNRSLPLKKASTFNRYYPACKPGPPLTVKYTGLVKPTVKVWTERVTGYSAMIVFQTSRLFNY